MRFPLLLLGLLLTAAATAQVREGTFRPASGTPMTWRINEHHALFWEGQPYRPVGLRLRGAVPEIEEAASQGVKDVVVELPAEGALWKPVVETLEARGMRYLIAIDSMAPLATGWIVEPQSYRIGGLTAKRTFDLPMPGVTSAIVVLALKRDSSITKYEVVPVSNERFLYTVDPPNDLEHVLLIYPHATSATTLDSWEGFDHHRDELLRSLKVEAQGRGLRGIVNPLGVQMPVGGVRTLVPTSPRFQDEFAMYLESRYRNIDSAQRAWSMSISEVETFSHLAKLIPLWQGTRGVEQLYDPITKQLIAVEAKQSAFWSDLRTVLNAAEARRFQRMVSGIRAIVDVPVLQEWIGWTTHYEVPNPQLDGIAMRTTGSTPTQLAESGARAASSLFRWSASGWLVAGLVDAEFADATTQIPNMLEDLQSLGAQAFFVRTSDPATRAVLVAENEKRITNAGAANTSPLPLFFPENAWNPAAAQRLPGGRWWLPAPFAGNRIDLGSQFHAYRSESVQGSSTVLWSRLAPMRVKLRFANPKTPAFATIDGTDPMPKVGKNHVEITLGPIPVIVTGTDEIPVPEPAMLEATARYEALKKEAESLRMSVDEALFVFVDAMAGFDRNPGGAFAVAMEALRTLNFHLARYMWIEAESFRDSSFSEVHPNVGCSGDAVLNLRSMLPGLVNDAFADYTFRNRSSAEVEVWIAAKIPPAYRRQVTLAVGGQVLHLEGDPVSHYGAGYGWYRMGTTRFAGATATVRLRVAADVGTDLSIDALVFAPGNFRPDGIRQPDAIPIPIPPIKG